MELLKADASKEVEAPRCYVPIWVPVESPLEKIQRAKEDLAASSITEDLLESNGQKETDTKATKKSPKPQRERKKSKSKSGEEKSADEGEKIENTEGLTPPQTPPKATSAGDSQSPLKKSPEKSSKSPKKSVGEKEPNTVQN